MKIAIVAGGTGGHLYPGVALARALVNHEITFVVRRGDLGREIISREGFGVREVAGAGLPRSISSKAFMYPFRTLRGIVETALFLITQKPDAIIGMGGYLSVPVILIGSLLGIPTMIHEQNVYPGLANRFLGYIVKSIAVSFKESQSYFPSHKVWLSGLPIRPDIGQVDQTTGRRQYGLDTQTKTYLVFGGSLGAHRLNVLMVDVWKRLARQPEAFQVLHITGPAEANAVEESYRTLPIKSKVLPYAHDMASAYAAADYVICRAGASTISELLMTKRKAVCIPYPHATNNHQYLNARVAEQMGLVTILEERMLSTDAMVEALCHIQVTGRPEVHESSTGAALRLANHLTALVR